MKYKIVLIAFSILAISCQKQNKIVTNFVNPFIGTDNAGNTNPAACVPFGMVQLGADTRMESWEGNSGYHHKDSVIIGFSHTHISGVGIATWGDVLFMPTVGKTFWNRGDKNNTKAGYSSTFSKKNETAEPGHYRVLLDDDDIEVNLTATERAGFHCYTFPKTDSANVIIDLVHRDYTRESYIKLINEYEIEGYRQTLGMADNHYVYFYAKFSEPIQNFQISKNDTLINEKSFTAQKIKAALRFKSDGSKPVYVKVGLSQVSCANAKNNLDTEISDWNFNEIKQKASEKWNDKLSRIIVETDSLPLKQIFYSALYHCFLSPQIASDADGSYRGMDNKIYKADGFVYYNVYSLWDTYRTLHPLFTIIDSKTNDDFIKSILTKFKQKPDRLVKWELASYDWGGMIGYPAVPMIVDAYMKGQRNFDTTLAWNAIQKTTSCNFEGLNSLKYLGFIPCDRLDQSLSRTVEMAYEDWCAAQMAKAMGKTSEYNYYLQRSKFYKNIYDSTTQLMRPRFANGDWIEPFITDKYTPDITESNATQYSCYSMHDMYSWIDMLGGNKKTEKWLDNFFDASKSEGLRIGFYEQGNEPTHHAVYEYNYIGKPWKTQKLIRDVFRVNFNNKADGLPGNDDCGQMSAWIVMSAMGFYPFCPGLPQYTIGEPMFNKVTISLENGKTFEIEANGTSEKKCYIQNATLNGNAYTKNYFEHSIIASGGKIEFTMGINPNIEWGSSKSNLPVYFDTDIKQADIPLIKTTDYYFEKSAKISFQTSDKNSKIFYTIDESEPTENSLLYTQPFEISETKTIKAKTFKTGFSPSFTIVDTIKKAVFHNAVNLTGKPVNGLKYNFYLIGISNLPDYKTLKPAKTGITDRFKLSLSPVADYYAFLFEGLIQVPQDGIYTFGILSDDGSRLIIDDTEVAVLDYGHPAIERSGKIGLKKGFHKFVLQYYENCGGEFLDVNWTVLGKAKVAIPAKNLYYQ